jgi:acyl carrier protein
MIKSEMQFDEFTTMISDFLGIDKSELGRNVSLQGDLGIDSLSVINFIVRLEKRYGIKFDEFTLAAMKNLGDFYDIFIDNVRRAERVG